MRDWLRFLLPLIAALGALTMIVSWAVNRTSQDWFERDVAMRSELAVSSARRSILRAWESHDYGLLRRQLSAISRDSRIMLAGACTLNGELVASSGEARTSWHCKEILTRRGNQEEPSWHGSMPGLENAYFSAVPIVEADKEVCLIVIVHDMSFAERRAAITRHFTWIALAVIALITAIITLLFTRHAWRSWNSEIRRLLRGEGTRPEFHPIRRAIQELVRDLSAEFESTADWNAARLKSILHRHLHGERIVVLANREPYIHEFKDKGAAANKGETVVLHPASGLVTALEPVMRACSGVWVAHGAGSADRITSDKNGRLGVPPGEDLYTLKRVWLTEEEEQGYYYGFANEGLWPLCHIAHTRPQFRAKDFRQYSRINARFAAAVAQECDVRDPIVWVQDYHFTLAPRLIRKKMPEATLLMFWHIPWPNAERFAICPWHKELVAGLLGSDILGFHTQLHCNNFLDAVDRFLEARIDREEHSVIYQGHETLIRPYPISVELPNHWTDAAPSVEVCRDQVLAECRLKKDALIGVGVDRVDYTKGIPERFLAVERALERFPDLRGRFTFVQLGAPSRTIIPRYRMLAEEIDALANRINQRFGRDDYRPIVIHQAHHEPPTVFKYYRAADLCYVSSLHDGMNLVAKEFVAARDDERGVLLLSNFAGASRELTAALVVNPYDFEEASSGFATALTMSDVEQQERMRSMRRHVSKFNVYRWAGRMMIDASLLRQRERLGSRFRSDR